MSCVTSHVMFHRQVIVMEPVVMTMSDTHDRAAAPAPADSCDDHDYENIRPIVIASAKFGARSLDTAADSASAAIIAETQALFETISIPGSVTRLVYSSPRSRGYLSTIQLQLTPDTVPATLSKIYLRITIEGELFEKIFEADPNLKYTYSWKGINVYRQRVYGTTTALVKVGYEYESCSTIIWNVQVRYILRKKYYRLYTKNICSRHGSLARTSVSATLAAGTWTSTTATTSR